MLRPAYLFALRKIKKKDEELQQKLKTFEEISQEIEKKINDQHLQPGLPFKKALKSIQNHLESKSLIKMNQLYNLIAPLIVLHPFSRNN